MSQHDPNDPNHPQGHWQGREQHGAWHQGPVSGGVQASSSFGGRFGGGAAAAARGRPIAGAVATAGANERLVFVRKVYAHLAGAIFLFAGLCYLWLGPLYESVALKVLGFATRGFNWLIFLGLFIGVSWLADKWARSDVSRKMQYAGLALYVLAESFIFIPLLVIASYYGGEGVIPTAGVITLLLFAGLTATVFITKKDFSFLGPALGIGAMAALGLIVLGIFVGFNLGVIFCWAMVVLASGYILYYTSRILAYYHPQQYVAASLALFSAVALLFYYVLMIVMDR